MIFGERFITYDNDVDGNLYELNLKDRFKNNIGRVDFVKRDSGVEILFIYVEESKRRCGNATNMLTELTNRYTVEWNGRFTKEGRLFYETWKEKIGEQR